MGVDASATARQVGITTTYRSLRSGNFENLPQRIALFAQGATASVGFSTAKWTALSPEEAAARYGVGSPIHLALLGLMPLLLKFQHILEQFCPKSKFSSSSPAIFFTIQYAKNFKICQYKKQFTFLIFSSIFITQD